MRRLSLLFPLSLAILLPACSADSASPNATPVANVADGESGDPTQITVYKSPTCGCCSAWVEHLESNNFAVQVVDMDNVNSVKEYYHIPSDLTACHTGIVDGYAIEGHVPAEDVRRLLEERPEAIGLAVPGMPIGSPGMEVEGRDADSYDVMLVTEGGSTVFASH